MVEQFKRINWGGFNDDKLRRAQDMLAQKYNYTPAAITGRFIRYNQNSSTTLTFHSNWTLELISRLYEYPIAIESSYIKGPNDMLINNYLPICTNILEAIKDYPTFFIIGAAPSVFKSKQVQQWREANGGYSTVQDNIILKRSSEFIMGMSKIRNTIIIFVNNQMTFDTSRQVLTWVLASKMLKPEVNPEPSTQTFVKRLTMLCAELTEKCTIFDDTHTGPHFKTFFDEYWESDDAFKVDIAKQISSFLQKRNMEQLKEMERDYESHQAKIRRAIKEIADHSGVVEQIAEQIAIVKQKLDAGTSNEIKEFLDFLERSKAITKYTFEDGNLIMTIDSFLYVNDPDQFIVVAKNMLKNRFRFDDEAIIDSYLKAFKKVFVDEEYKARTMAVVQLDMLNMAPSRYNGIGIPEDRIPSPHIVHYNCWGAHTKLIAERVAARDLMGVIEQIIEACSGLNVYDSPVVSKFFSSLFDRDAGKCFIDANKKEVSLREIMEVGNETDECIQADPDN